MIAKAVSTNSLYQQQCDLSVVSEEDDLQKALELSKKEEQDRLKTVEKYNELSLTEDWEADSK